MKLHLPKLLLVAIMACGSTYALTVDTESTAGSTVVTNTDGTWSKTYTSDTVSTNEIPSESKNATLVISGTTQIGCNTSDATSSYAGDIIVGGAGQLFLQTWNTGTQGITINNNIYLGSTTGEGGYGAVRVGPYNGGVILNGDVTLVENSSIWKEKKKETIGSLTFNGKVSGDYTLTSYSMDATEFAGEVDLGGLNFSLRATGDYSTHQQATFKNTTGIDTLTISSATTLTFDANGKTATIGTVAGDASLGLIVAEGTTLDIQGGNIFTTTIKAFESNGYTYSGGVATEITGLGTLELGDGVTINGVALSGYELSEGGLTITYATAQTDTMYHVVKGTVNIGDVSTTVTDTHKGYIVYQGATLDIKGTQNDGQVVELRSGATLANSGNNISDATGYNQQQIKELVLTGDATVSTTGNMGVVASSWAQSTLNLNEKKLTKSGANMFSVVNANISAGTIDIQAGSVKLIGKSGDGAGSLNINDNVVFNVNTGATLEWWNDTTAGNYTGTFLRNATGAGNINIDLQNGSSVIIHGTAGSVKEVGFSGTLNMSSDTKLVLGAAYQGDEGYTHAGWALDMKDATISLNGGGLRFCGHNTTIGTLDVNAADTLLIHDTRNNTSTGLTVKTLNLDADLTLTSKWKGIMDIETVTGSGNLSVNTNNAEVTVNVKSIGSEYSGAISTAANSKLNLGTDANSSIYLANTITNAGTLTVNGTIVLSDNLDGFTVIDQNGTSGGLSANNGQDGYEITEGETTYQLVSNTGSATISSTEATLGDGTVQLTQDEETGSVTFVHTGTSMDNIYRVNTQDITIGGGNATDNTERATSFIVADGRTVTIADGSNLASAGDLLVNSTGAGNVTLNTEATVSNSKVTQITGKLSIGQGGTLKIGSQDTQENNVSSFSAVELDGGSIYYQNAGGTINNLSTTSQGGTFDMYDMGDGNLTLAGTTTLVGNLTYRNTWNSQVVVEKIAGAGNLILDGSVRAAGNNSTFTISAVDNFTGQVQMINKAQKIKLIIGDDLGVTTKVTTRSGNTSDGLNLTGIGAGNTVILEGVKGYLDGVSNSACTIAADVVMNNSSDGAYAALELDNGSSGATYEFAGKVSGSGNLVVNKENVNMNIKFSDDVSEWTGNITFLKSTSTAQELIYTGDATVVNSRSINASGSSNVHIKFEHNAAATVNSSITSASESTSSITVSNTHAGGTTFTNAVAADSVTVTNGTKISLGNTMTTTDFTLGADATLDFAGGKLTVTNSITLGTVTVSDYDSYFNAENLTTTLVTAGGITGWNGPIVDTYTVDGKNYTTTIAQDGNNITLNFTAEASAVSGLVTGVVGFVETDNMLTLNYDGDLANASSALVTGISDEVMKDILGLAGLPEDGMVGITLQDANGTQFTATADKIVGFQGADGNVYEGTVVGDSREYRVDYIPEPASATLGLAALMMLCARRRRK